MKGETLVYPEPPSREILQATLHVFIEIYANRHLELDEQCRRSHLSLQDFSLASRRLTAIKATLEAYWLNTPFLLPPEYQFDPEELSRVIHAEIHRCQLFPDSEPLIAALEVINSLIIPWTPDFEEEEEAWIEGEMPSVHWDG
jgi:hypothetical protein